MGISLVGISSGIVFRMCFFFFSLSILSLLYSYVSRQFRQSGRKCARFLYGSVTDISFCR